MPRTAAGLRTDPSARIAELARQHPEWQDWTALLETAWRSVDGWSTQFDATSLTRGPNAPQPAPLLHEQTLRVDARLARRLVSDLGSALRLNLDLTEAQSLQLIGAAIGEQIPVIQALAAEHAVDSAVLGSVAHMAALPLLQACGRELQDRLPVHWSAGYCPICAAWAVLAERRGLDRSRRLRCGRCAADWEVEWLYCVYCGERDHRKLGSLVPDDSAELLKVETCDTCQGYLKSVASLQGLLPFELLLQDLETIELDLVALERGYRRPHAGAFALNVSVLEHAARPGL